MAVVQTDSLQKVYGGSVVALDGLDLEVRPGEVYGFLGPNGAGKSTTINVLLGFVRPTQGSATVLGHDVVEESVALRERIGVLPEGVTPYERLTGREHVEFAAEVKDVDADVGGILERVGLSSEAANRNAGDYSKGMAQRLNLGMALVGDPDLLILDEPSSGLDPTGIEEMRELLRRESADGTTVFFSSHILGEVESVCDRVGILNGGRLVAEDTVEGLRDANGTTATISVEFAGQVGDDVAATARSVPDVQSVACNGSVVRVDAPADAKFEVLDALGETAAVEDFTVEEPSLEDVFAEYTEENPTVGA